MKIPTIKFTTILSTALFITAIVLFKPIEASAQILKPGEIIYSRAVTVPGGNCDTASIWAVGQDGANDRFITQGLHPRISPDGRRILFKRFDTSTLCNPFFNGAPQWWIRDLATKQETMIAQNFRTAFGHFFSPDTNRADSQIIFDDTNFLCRMNTDGTNKVCVGTPTLDPLRGAGHLGVRGSDNLIVVQNYDTLNASVGGLYTMAYDTLSNRQKIPNTSFGDLSPAWSNDGQTVSFAKFANNRGAHYPYSFDNLYSIKPDGSGFTQLTFFSNLPTNDGFGYSLVWTNDNQTILNAARINGVAGIYKIPADGSGTLTRIPITPGAVPDWVGGIVPPMMEQQVAGMGGGLISNENFSLVSTVGQSFAGQISTAGAFNLQSGFWIDSAGLHAPFDFDGDGKSDISVFRAAGGFWYLNQSQTGFRSVAFGQNNDLPAPADFDGDGKTDVAVFRPSNGAWYYLKSSDATFVAASFGQNGDLPRPGDFDGDGKADICVFRPSTGAWYRLNSFNGAFFAAFFGQNGDKPLSADFDGDGKKDIAVFRPSNGQFYWLDSSSGQFKSINFGISTDIPTMGDFDGDGKTDIAVFRPSNGTWYRINSMNNSINIVTFGQNGDIPATADYDGDGKSDIAVFRPSNGSWYYLTSANGAFAAQSFGLSTDIPIPSAFNQ